MTFFAIELRDDARAELFMRSLSHSFWWTELFQGVVKRVPVEPGMSRYFFSFMIRYPIPFGKIALIVLGGLLVTVGFSWWLLIPLCIALPDFLKNRWFAIAMVFLALRKEGYKGPVSVVSYDLLFDEMVR